MSLRKQILYKSSDLEKSDKKLSEFVGPREKLLPLLATTQPKRCKVVQTGSQFIEVVILKNLQTKAERTELVRVVGPREKLVPPAVI